jgi:His/Glu/Gln/Arg/opine family amino acid ABC transporter permease subunit
MSSPFTGLSLSDAGFLLQGALNTLALTVSALAAGLPLAVLFGLGRAAGRSWLAMIIGAVVDVARTVPLVIQFIVVQSGIALLGIPTNPFISGLIVLSLYVAAYGGELVSGGIEAVPQPLRRAARSLGMNALQDLRHIVLPIGLRAVLPSFAGLVGGLLKDTALVAVIGYVDLLRSGQIIVNRTQEPLLILTGVGLVYFGLCYPIARISGKFERGATA